MGYSSRPASIVNYYVNGRDHRDQVQVTLDCVNEIMDVEGQAIESRL